MPRYLAAVVLLASLLLPACSRELDRVEVAQFIDRADEAARKRYAPDICALRGKKFESRLVFHAYAEGVQIYQWDGTTWAFRGPSASLYSDAGGRGLVGTHYAGPTWASNSGSLVVGMLHTP